MNALLSACSSCPLSDCWPVGLIGVFVGAAGMLRFLDWLSGRP